MFDTKFHLIVRDKEVERIKKYYELADKWCKRLFWNETLIWLRNKINQPLRFHNISHIPCILIVDKINPEIICGLAGEIEAEWDISCVVSNRNNGTICYDFGEFDITLMSPDCSFTIEKIETTKKIANC